ncbi:polysaccharide biosynthesis/export family protein [Flavobacterium sp.]|uniref:polysaccharide biosynthesis/export family protein n=1 Tax=Flavobacterium sp. TaxID=239 RepID=UPI0025BF442B|nr:polysaccharide biosynthesis/export family protein [Flavobacterium sp.]
MKRLCNYLFVLTAALLLNACTTQNLFQNSKHNYSACDSIPPGIPEHILKPDDKITISIWSHDDLSVGSLFGVYNSNEVYGKWIMINQLGEVTLPQIGTVVLGGLTPRAAGDSLRTLYAKYIVDPVVVVKVINMEVTVLGEVFKAGKYTIDKDYNTVVEMLGLAGGLDFYADKKHIQVIRGSGSDTKQFTLDLTCMDDYKQKNLVLEAGDVIYVPTRKSKMVDKKAPVLIAVSSTLTATLVLIKFFQ